MSLMVAKTYFIAMPLAFATMIFFAPKDFMQA